MTNKPFLIKSLMVFLFFFMMSGTMVAQSKKKSKKKKQEVTRWVSGNANYFHKLYENEIERISDFYIQSDRDETSALMLGLGLKKVNKNRFQEFSLIALNFRRDFSETQIERIDINETEPVRGAKVTRLDTGVRWEYGFLTKEKSKFRLGISAGVDHTFKYIRYLPLVTTAYPQTTIETGFDIRLIPRAEILLKKNMQLVFKVPVGIFSVGYRYNKLENPIFIQRNQSFWSPVFDLIFDDIQASIGLGMKF